MNTCILGRGPGPERPRTGATMEEPKGWKQYLRTFTATKAKKINFVVSLVFMLGIAGMIYHVHNFERPPYNTWSDLTIVTAYFNIGEFQKGYATKLRAPDDYRNWARSYGRMHNNLVVYTDDLAFKKLMETSRNTVGLSHHTSVVYIQNRSSLWAFGLKPEIQSIYAQPNYPKHPPNTVVPDYACATSAKYEVVARTISENNFPATHYAWIDFGYFRDIANQRFNFTLKVPDDFDDNKIAYLRINKASLKVNPKHVLLQNANWVAGGMFIGTKNKMLVYVEQYKRAVRVFLNEKIMNSDQQIVYGMFTDIGRQKIKPTVEIQLYVPKGPVNPWFYLGFHCLRKVNASVPR